MSIDHHFEPCAEAVEQFASLQGMELFKGARGNNGWELVSPHPLGGAIHLLMMYHDELGLGIGSTWQVPVSEMNMLYSHFRNMQPVRISSDEVIEALTRELTSITNIKFGHWTHMRPLAPDDNASERPV